MTGRAAAGMLTNGEISWTDSAMLNCRRSFTSSKSVSTLLDIKGQKLMLRFQLWPRGFSITLRFIVPRHRSLYRESRRPHAPAIPYLV